MDNNGVAVNGDLVVVNFSQNTIFFWKVNLVRGNLIWCFIFNFKLEIFFKIIDSYKNMRGNAVGEHGGRAEMEMDRPQF